MRDAYYDSCQVNIFVPVSSRAGSYVSEFKKVFYSCSSTVYSLPFKPTFFPEKAGGYCPTEKLVDRWRPCERKNFAIAAVLQILWGGHSSMEGLKANCKHTKSYSSAHVWVYGGPKWTEHTSAAKSYIITEFSQSHAIHYMFLVFFCFLFAQWAWNTVQICYSSLWGGCAVKHEWAWATLAVLMFLEESNTASLVLSCCSAQRVRPVLRPCCRA